MVYEAWKSAGLNEQQAKIMTAEVGRENDYNPNYLFGYHEDHNNGKTNVGMLSWQGDRATEAKQRLRSAGLLKGIKITQSQESLNLMAQYAVYEMLNKSRFAKTKNEFLANPQY